MQSVQSVPDLIYWVAGLLILSNVGTICSILYVGAKAVWWASKVDTRLGHTEADVSEIKDGLRHFVPSSR